MDNRIREHRLKRGWTMEQLAEKVGTTNPQISRLERGDRQLTVRWMVRLSQALGVNQSDLLIAPTDIVAPSVAPSDSNTIQDAAERRLLRVWRAMSPDAQDTFLQTVDLWAAQIIKDGSK